MTSKKFCFNAMKEDIRHKLWMVALSFLGNFLVLPVGWMIWRSEAMDFYDNIEYYLTWGGRSIQEVIDGIIEYFVAYLTMGGGIIAVIGAVIVGLFSFRYLFHRQMVDTYHSLPVKRGTLYRVFCVNGILIWFIPFIINAMLMFFLAAILLVQVGGGGSIPLLLGEALFSIVVLAAAYLLVYHIVLLAVMLSGNVLNTMVSASILGFGIIAFYGLLVAFLDGYMITFNTVSMDMAPVTWFSPLLAAPYLLVLRMENTAPWEVWKGIGICLAEGILLGAAVRNLYRRRAFEAAEQGLWNGKVAAVLRIFTGVIAGLCGWGFFAVLLSDSGAYGWEIFGTVLAVICTFGILDIIFQMDFKAFFSHKGQMAATLAAALALCFSFCGDWLGYDTYLPKPGKVAEIAVYDSSLANRYREYGVWNGSLMEDMHFKDRDRIDSFLQRMTEHEREDIGYVESERVSVRVTLDSGRVYYRDYRMRKEDAELVMPIFTSEEYLRGAWLIEETLLPYCDSFMLDLGTGQYYLTPDSPEVAAILKAYNQDVLEQPEAVLKREGRLEAGLEVGFSKETEDGERFHDSMRIEVYDFMGHTAETLEKAGFVSPTLEEMGVESVVLPLSYEGDGEGASEERLEAARKKYGVYGESPDAEGDGQGEDLTPDPGKSERVEASEETTANYLPTAVEGEITAVQWMTGGLGALEITDPAEMREIFGLLSFEVPWRYSSVFGEGYTDVILRFFDGREEEWFLPMGTLPEKYILRFGE